MDMVKPPHPVALDDRAAIQEFVEKDEAPGPVQARQPRHGSPALQHELLREPEDAARLARGFGGRILIHPGTVRLRVNGGAAREEERRRPERTQEILRAEQIDAAVFLRAAATRAGAVKDRVHPADAPAQLLQRGFDGYIASENGGAGGRPRQRDDVPPRFAEKPGRLPAQKTAPGQQEALHSQSISRLSRASPSKVK